ncbi:serine/threonine protein kinase [Hyalangium versicolor]|uniref:serine/threonine protein kinase n=1 Tax=Hyalangium versicolor TaxID=2861190 RepID=UPI001CC9A0A4|nr:serine/threonine-protein kinase [Hyalangium versicolor]
MSATAESQPGALLLGRYEIVSELGRGGMATVYRARAAGPMGFEKTLVVKCILPHLVEDPQFIEMFHSEAKLAAQLTHPNIVQIFDFGEAEGTYFIAMEYVDGPNLRALMRRAQTLGKALPLPLCAKIVSQACEGLAFAHEFTAPDTGEPLHLIHRDVSPDNILLARNGTVKLVDFGIVKAANQVHQTRVGTLKGKVPFMAPEQLRNEPFDLRIDVYALGVVLYELVTGRRPYEAPHEAALIHAILNEPIIPVASRRPDVPEALQHIISRALAKNPDERYASCREMQSDLDHFLLSLGQPVGSYQLSQLISQLAVQSMNGGASPGTPVSMNRFRTPGTSGTGTRPRLPGATPPPPPTPDLPVLDIEMVTEESSVGSPPPPPSPQAPVASPAPPAASRRWLFPAAGAALVLVAVVIVVLGRSGSQETPAPLAPVQPATPPVAVAPPPQAPSKPVEAEADEPPEEAPAEPPAGSVAESAATTAKDAAPPAAPTPLPTPPSKIELQIVVSPRKAQVTLDNKPLNRLPFTGRFPRDGKVHVLRVSAPGYTPLVKEIPFEKDLAVDLTLQKKVPESRKPAAAKAAAPSTVASEPAPKQEAEVDFPELAPKAPKGARPKKTLDEESPWDDGSQKTDAPRP